MVATAVLSGDAPPPPREELVAQISPGAGHAGGLDAQPEEYEARVVGFFDRALLGD